MLGYDWSRDYMAGKSRNRTILTWIGIHGNLSFNEAYNHLYRSSLDNIHINSTNESLSNRILVPHGTCKVFEGKPPNFVKINISTEYAEYFVFVSDSTSATNFQLASSLMHGDRIYLHPSKNSSLRKYTIYNIKLKENRIETKDQSCAAYPNENHESYTACLQADLRRQIMPILGQGLFQND